MKKTGLFVTVVALVAALSAPAWVADEPKKDESDKSREQKPSSERSDDRPVNPFMQASKDRPPKERKVYTTEDLEKMYRGEYDQPSSEKAASGAEPGSTAKADETSGDAKPESNPLDYLKEQRAQQQEKAAAIREAQQELTDAEQRVKQLEERLLKIRNPYLAPPKPDDDDKEEWDSENNVERVKGTEAKLAVARKAVEEARRKLQDAQRR